MNPADEGTASAVPSTKSVNSSSAIDDCPIRSLVAGHYDSSGVCGCVREGRALEMCGTCTGTGKLTVPGQRHDLQRCGACNGEGVR